MSAEAIALSYDPQDPYAIRNGVAMRWLTRDRRSLLIADMGDQHLLNTIRFIERKLVERHDKALRVVAGMRCGEYAAIAEWNADLAMDAFIRLGTLAEPVLRGLRAEAQRRELPELVP